MKICPPQVNQKQTKVAEATGFVSVNPGTWALKGNIENLSQQPRTVLKTVSTRNANCQDDG